MTYSKLLATTALSGMLVIAPAQAFAQSTPNVPSADQAQAQPAATGADTTQTEESSVQSNDAQSKAVSADGQSRSDNTVVVTGSRIPRPETAGILPGVQITRNSIETRGFSSALDIVNDIPFVAVGSSPNGNNGGQSASLGASFINIFDLGTQRTLTLVNGRRFVSGNSATLFVAGNNTGSQVDVNSIPSTLIERVDAVTIGGAAAYGSDAIAGVVNYVLRNDYQGTEFSGLAGISSRGDTGNQQIQATTGRNFAEGRGNITLSGEYTHNDGLQADARGFRLLRPTTITNYLNGGVRNPTFGSGIIDVQGTNNGAFLRSTDDQQPSTLFALGLVNQSLSYPGTVLNLQSGLATPYTPIATTAGGKTYTSNFITLANGLGSVSQAVTGTAPDGTTRAFSLANNSYFSTAAQLVPGLPGATLITGNGLNGRTTAVAGLPITTFAPTALPAGVTAAQVFTQFGVTPPAGATASQLSTLAINVLQANRPTAREFFAQNPNTPTNYFLGTFVPGVPRVANTDTTLVTVAGVKVPVNQVLPFVAVPLQFNTNGSLSPYTAATLTPTTPGTFGQAPGSNGGFREALGNTVLRAQQDRAVFNGLGHFDLTDNITLFTEDLYAYTRSISLRNSPSQNFLSTGAENAALVVNVNNPYLTAQDRSVLNSVGISGTNTANNGNFVVTRQNQDIFGDNPFRADSWTMRAVGGVRSKFDLFGHHWTAEASGTYGRVVERVHTTQINDVEYQLALDAVDQGTATTGVANGNIVCRAQLFPAQYLGRTPVGTTGNLTRQLGADGLPTETVITPTITQAMINACRPLNPFGYDNMSAASKAYVRQDNLSRNVSEQVLADANVTGAFFDLPAGPLQFSVNGEYRRESLAFTTDPLNQLGRGRAAPSAATIGYTQTYEVGGELAVPITGPNFLPFLGTLELDPALRASKQDGAAQDYRNLAGTVIQPRAKGDWNTIYTLGGRWTPVRDITFRGNYTRAVRNPSVVELFLGGQPVFTTPTDYCSTANIDRGSRATNRRANCEADVIAHGLAADKTTADAFLAAYVPNGAGLQGSYTGSPNLTPEKSEAWTAGGAFTPRFLPGLVLQGDYYELTLRNQITPTTLAQAIQFCYDSTTYPNTSAQTGVNTCSFFSRSGTDFQLQNGFGSGFINLAALKQRGISASAAYSFKLPENIGKFDLSSTAYHLITYQTSAAGDFSDKVENAGSYTDPKWKVQVRGRFTSGDFFAQAVWNWTDSTQLFVSGLPAGLEDYPNVTIPNYSTFDLAFGANVSDRFSLQLNVFNLTDNSYADSTALYTGNYIDQIGRRFQVVARAKF